ncbi:MAG: D-2-hydroxyacid dehydrogenase, partial [Acidobacteria bacterium]|nr:D-2-hydroxyacid dehydrogenase [Acidobacteriota bacterium]
MKPRTALLSLLPASLPALLLALLLSGAAAAQTKVVVTGMDGPDLAELRAAAPSARIVSASGEAQLRREIADAEGFLGSPTPELLRAVPKLRWVQVGSAGVDTLRFPELLNSNITLTNCKIIQGPEIADHAFALLLALTRRLNELIPRKAREEWPLAEFRTPDKQPTELHERTALVIGMGGIGTQIAQRAHAFGMEAYGIDPKDISMTYFTRGVYPPDKLRELLPRSDVVFMAAPHTPESDKMLGPDEFRMMKRGAYFIAVSRGKTYDGQALVKALDEKHLAGAGLDVTDPEPLPKGHPLWKFENVVITPHLAGTSDKFRVRQMGVF